MEEPNPTNERRHVVFLVHGIRTQGEWATRAAAILESDPTIRVRPIRYEFFDILRFLIPLPIFRNKPVSRVTKLIRDELSRNPSSISIIAHSFGTYILGRILSEEPDICFHRTILCGSILSDSFDWERYGHRLDADEHGDWHGVNDCGMRDIWPVFAKSVTWGYGSSGRFGFGHPRIKDRFFSVGHGGFFDNDFIHDRWLPYLAQGRIVDGELDRPTNPWWVSVLTVAKLRYVIVLLALAWGGAFNKIDIRFPGPNTVDVRPLTVAQLSTDDKQTLEEIKKGEYVNVSLESFFSVAVLSGQITESELDTFLSLASDLLKSDTDYYGTGDRDGISVGTNWEILIMRTKSRDVFRKTQAGLLQVIEYLRANRRGGERRPKELIGVEIMIRGTGRFFDVKGIPGSGLRTWVGFDLR